MRDISNYKTMGALLDALNLALKGALEAAQKHYGTREYFVERRLAVHRAFDAFAKDHRVCGERTGELRNIIRQHTRGYPHALSQGVRVLLDELPDQFNVRGQWTSERARLVEA